MISRYKLSDFYNVRDSTLNLLQRGDFHNKLFDFCNVRASSKNFLLNFFLKLGQNFDVWGRNWICIRKNHLMESKYSAII